MSNSWIQNCETGEALKMHFKSGVPGETAFVSVVVQMSDSEQFDISEHLAEGLSCRHSA